jgi:hypothetical protein
MRHDRATAGEAQAAAMRAIAGARPEEAALLDAGSVRILWGPASWLAYDVSAPPSIIVSLGVEIGSSSRAFRPGLRLCGRRVP